MSNPMFRCPHQSYLACAWQKATNKEISTQQHCFTGWTG